MIETKQWYRVWQTLDWVWQTLKEFGWLWKTLDWVWKTLDQLCINSGRHWKSSCPTCWILPETDLSVSQLILNDDDDDISLARLTWTCLPSWAVTWNANTHNHTEPCNPVKAAEKRPTKIILLIIIITEDERERLSRSCCWRGSQDCQAALAFPSCISFDEEEEEDASCSKSKGQWLWKRTLENF